MNKKLTEEHKRKIGEANSKALKGKVLSDNHKKNISNGLRLSWNDPKSKFNTYERMIGTKNPFFGKHHTKESKELISKKVSGKNHSNWKGGIFFQKGYKFVNGEAEHITVMEVKLGRKLNKGEVVHHINGIKDDNCPENLQLFSSNSKHIKFHRANPEIGMNLPEVE